jgi:hypothetical protein
MYYLGAKEKMSLIKNKLSTQMYFLCSYMNTICALEQITIIYIL